MDMKELVAFQLGLEKAGRVEFEQGGGTRVTPAPLTPVVTSAEPLSLEGEWEVTYWPFPKAVEEILGKAEGEAQWEPIQQPGKVSYADPEETPGSVEGWNRVTLEHHDPEDGALIRREVKIPDFWSGKRVLLRFDGIYPAGRIYWDGEEINAQWSGLTPLEIDVTKRCRPGGRHQVAVRFYRRHASVVLDMPRHALEFVGLCRGAFLHAVEPVGVADLRLVADLGEDCRTGTLTAEMLLSNSTTAKGALIELLLLDANGNLVGESDDTLDVPAGGKAPLTLATPPQEVQTWNDEEPYLYMAVVRVICEGQEVQEIRQRVGFRRFELRDERPWLNGNPVKFRGVNHLTAHPTEGLVTPEPWLRQCLTMMKRANVNAVRTHYFGPPELTDLCDELGLYLLQELPIDWGHPYVHDPEQLGPILHRMEAGVRRDRNHPSVMVWSIGNENIPSTEEVHEVFFEHLRLAGEMVRTVDPTRPQMFPPPGPGRSCAGFFEWRLGEIGDIHYSFELIRQLNETGELKNPRTWEPTYETTTREEMLARGPWTGVWFSSEYGLNNQLADLLNAPYTSVINDVPEDPLSGKNSLQVFIDRLRREWGYMRDDPTCLGGAYFPWIACGAGDPWGWERWGEDADWGVLTQDLTPKPAFWGMRVIFSPVIFPERVPWKPGDTAITFPVRNLYNRWDLAECTLRTQMKAGPRWMGMMRDWQDIPMQGAPGTTAEVTIPLWDEGTLKLLNEGTPGCLRCTVLDPNGFRAIMADVLVIPEETEVKEEGVVIGPDVEA